MDGLPAEHRGPMTGVSEPGTAALVAALERSRGTVTQFLEGLAGEPIDADIIAQGASPAGHDNSLGIDPDTELLRRAVVLTGRSTGRRFVYAESAIAAERLPDSVRKRLEQSRDPIGRVLLDHRLAVHREPLAGLVVADGTDAETRALLDESAWSRRYRIVVDGQAAIVVNEWFLTAVPEALATHSRSSASPNPSSGG